MSCNDCKSYKWLLEQSHKEIAEMREIAERLAEMLCEKSNCYDCILVNRHCGGHKDLVKHKGLKPR